MQAQVQSRRQRRLTGVAWQAWWMRRGPQHSLGPTAGTTGKCVGNPGLCRGSCIASCCSCNCSPASAGLEACFTICPSPFLSIFLTPSPACTPRVFLHHHSLPRCPRVSSRCPARRPAPANTLALALFAHTREMPGNYIATKENSFNDPSHDTVLHHGVSPALKRDNAGPMGTELVEMTPTGYKMK